MSGYKRHIFVCTNQRSLDDPRGSCSKLGSEALHARFKQEAKRLDLKDVVRANKAGCLDHCAQGPSVVIYPEGVWYQVKSNRFASCLKRAWSASDPSLEQLPRGSSGLRWLVQT